MELRGNMPVKSRSSLFLILVSMTSVDSPSLWYLTETTDTRMHELTALGAGKTIRLYLALSYVFFTLWQNTSLDEPWASPRRVGSMQCL